MTPQRLHVWFSKKNIREYDIVWSIRKLIVFIFKNKKLIEYEK